MTDPTPARPAPRAATILSLLALTLSVGLACALWYLFATLDRSEQERVAHARRVILVEEENAQLRRQVAELGQRIDDDDALNRSLREETLGIAERAALLEQAIKRVSENRMDSVSELRLNQAELLLSAGIERLAVFHDAPASLAALRLADAELARLGDARYAGVRQTLAQEIAALEALPVRAHADTLVILADLRARVGQLPMRGSGPTAAVVSKKLGRLVQVRRVNPREAGMLGPLGADTLRAVIVLDLLNAEEALRQRDLVRFRLLVQQARETVQMAFDLDAPGAHDVRLKLAQIAAYVPAELPQTGAALAQLVNLRHTQNVAHGVER